MINSVRGPVDAADLGTTLMHEHVFVLTADSQQQWPGEWDEESKVAEAVTKLKELAASGVRTIVDPTVIGLGRFGGADLSYASDLDMLFVYDGAGAAATAHVAEEVAAHLDIGGGGDSSGIRAQGDRGTLGLEAQLEGVREAPPHLLHRPQRPHRLAPDQRAEHSFLLAGISHAKMNLACAKLI